MASNSKGNGVRNRIRMSRAEWAFEIFNYTFIAIFAFACLYPFLNTIAVSFSSNRAILSKEVFIVPVEFNLTAYERIWTDGILGRAMINTIYLTVGGTIVNMVGTILFAYPMSRPPFPGKKLILTLMVVTMFIGGGLIPSFILMRNLGLMEKFEGLWIQSFYSIGNMIMLRTFFQQQPEELNESARIDGANDFVVLTRIVLPVSMPILATLTLFYAVGWWNSYMGPLLYIHDADKITLMLRLRQILWMGTQDIQQVYEEGVAVNQKLTPEAVKGATIMVSTLPILLVYPFLQKYFAKGVMVGSIKG